MFWSLCLPISFFNVFHLSFPCFGPSAFPSHFSILFSLSFSIFSLFFPFPISFSNFPALHLLSSVSVCSVLTGTTATVIRVHRHRPRVCPNRPRVRHYHVESISSPSTRPLSISLLRFHVFSSCSRISPKSQE